MKDFEGAYAAEKARRGMVDFADLEHMAVRLLVGEDGAPTELARQWSARKRWRNLKPYGWHG